MVTSIIFLNVEKNQVNAVAEELAAMSEMSEVFSVSGQYDIVGIIRVNSNDDLAEFVTNKLLKVNGITKSYTSLAFKAFSRHDLDAVFSL